MKKKIEYCPFCGATAILQRTLNDEAYVMCEVCFARTKKFKASTAYCADDEAIEAWNKRAKK